MPKLHELLAVKSNLQGQAEAARKDLANTFEKKVHHFAEVRKTFRPNGEGQQEKVEEQKDLQTTVKGELAWLSPFIIKAIDASAQVNEANTQARADVFLEDGTKLLADVPATTLLELEGGLKELHAFVAAIPTLDPAKGFKLDADRGANVFRARDVLKTRTKKETKHVVVVPPTDKHPAQVVSSTEDVPVGELLEQEWSGLITTAEKGLMIERVEDIQRAVKKARSRANDIEVAAEQGRLGKKLIGYLFGN
jgi:hypothetical protein